MLFPAAIVLTSPISGKLELVLEIASNLAVGTYYGILCLVSQLFMSVISFGIKSFLCDLCFSVSAGSPSVPVHLSPKYWIATSVSSSVMSASFLIGPYCSSIFVSLSS